VLIDCPVVDGATMAALARLDMRAAHVGAQLIVSTSVEALDDVFAALDQSDPQILVGPSRAERIIALGHVLARLPQRRVRELSEEDRLVLLRLTQQVTQIAERIDRLSEGRPRLRRSPRLLPRPSASRPQRMRAASGWCALAARRCLIHVWSARSSASASCGRATSMANCLPIRPGTCCWI
jgi:hypothetical protein